MYWLPHILLFPELDGDLLDQDTTTLVHSAIETPNIFGRNLLQRLGLALGEDEAEAVGTASSSYTSPK